VGGASWATAGIAIADASKSTANWPGNGVKIAILFFMDLDYLAMHISQTLTICESSCTVRSHRETATAVPKQHGHG
jgi:hypothetical protein